MTKKPTTRTMIAMRLPDGTFAKLQAVSSLIGQSQAALVTDALEQYLPRVVEENEVSARLVGQVTRQKLSLLSKRSTDGA